MNKIGIHYAFWGNSWDIDIMERIRYASQIGFECMDVTPPDYLTNLEYDRMSELKKCSEQYGVEMNFCIGFPKAKDMASPEASVRKAGIEYSKRMIEAVSFMGGKMLSGILYSCWPYLYDHPISRADKEDAWKRGLESVQKVLPVADDFGVDYAIELVNRFEQYILNSVDEGLKFCEQLQHPNVGLLIDVFHANIEEDSISGAIRKAGSRLKHMHVSENNRRLPGTGHHINWEEVFASIKEIDFQGAVVMEPFIEGFGEVGNDLRIWRDLEQDVSKEARDRYLTDAIRFIKKGLER